jgi:hypothetical protein
LVLREKNAGWCLIKGHWEDVVRIAPFFAHHLWGVQGFAARGVDVARHPQVEAGGEMVIGAERNLRPKDVMGLQVTKAFKGFSGLFHGTVRRIAGVKRMPKFPVISVLGFL